MVGRPILRSIDLRLYSVNALGNREIDCFVRVGPLFFGGLAAHWVTTTLLSRAAKGMELGLSGTA